MPELSAFGMLQRRSKKLSTLGEKLRASGGIGPGFDAVRLFLALGVLLWHSFPLTAGSPALIYTTPFWFLVNAMVPMFFALSGFLVIASALRLPWKEFALNRIARIVPALTAVVLMWSFILGPMLSNQTLSEYFSDSMTYRYVINILGLTAYNLPGVFENLPFARAVNGSLWTVRYEYLCYVIVGFLIAVNWIRRSSIIWAIIAFFIIASLTQSYWLQVPQFDYLNRVMKFTLTVKVVLFFFVGAITYISRDRIPSDWRLALISFLIIIGVGFAFDSSVASSSWIWALSSIPFTYLVVWSGLQKLPRPWFFGYNDLSYGVYLWHFPILQMIVLFTGVTSWWILSLTAIIPVLVLALLSWKLVEAPAMQLRKRYKVAAFAGEKT